MTSKNPIAAGNFYGFLHGTMNVVNSYNYALEWQKTARYCDSEDAEPLAKPLRGLKNCDLIHTEYRDDLDVERKIGKLIRTILQM